VDDADTGGTTQPAPSARGIVLSLLVLAVAGVASVAGSVYIGTAFPDRPTPRDALFELLPYVSSVRYLTAVALVAAFALFFRYALRFERREIPAFIAIFGLMYLLRAVIMVLTPLGDAQGPGSYVFPFVQHGMFPSGHTAAALLCARLVDRAKAPRLRRVQQALATVVAVALVVSHGHYTIDVVGGALLAYFVEQEWRHGRLFGPVKRLIGRP